MVKSLNGCALLLCVFATGCGGGLGTVPAGGTVMLDGKATEGISVLLTPDASDGMPASGVTDASGAFKLTTKINGDGALPGSYKVTIRKYEQSGPDVPEGGEGVSDDELDMDAMYSALDKGGKVTSKRMIAQRFENAATSGLAATVKEDAEANTFTFEVSKK